MKEVYKALESLDGGAELVELVKASEKKNGELEKENRNLKSEAEQYSGIDLAELKTAKEFVENAGGVESLQKALAKADGYDTNEEKLKAKQAEYDALKEKHSKEAESFQARIEEGNLRAELLPQFVESFNGSNVLLDRAISSGIVGKSETGLYYKNGDETISFSAGGFDKLKEHTDFSFALKAPSGGDEGAGSGGEVGSATKEFKWKIN